jgi:hypothetical protein
VGVVQAAGVAVVVGVVQAAGVAVVVGWCELGC